MNSDGEEFKDFFSDLRLVETRSRMVRILGADHWHESAAIAMSFCGKCPAAVKLGPLSCEAVYRNQCRQRLCPVCATIKAGNHRESLLRVIQERIASGARFSMMALTIRHKSNDRLYSLLKVLFEALKRFRKTEFFKRNIRGWARGIEITRTEENGFHPHAHFIIEAGFISLDQLYATWAKCVAKAGGGEVERQGVDLKAPESTTALYEAIGYPFKVANLAAWTDEQIIELAEAVKGRHLFQACRAWSRRSAELDEVAKLSDEVHNETRMVRFVDFLASVRNGELEACTYVPSVAALLSAMEGFQPIALMMVSVAPADWRIDWGIPEAAA